MINESVAPLRVLGNSPDRRKIGVLLSHGFTGSPVSMRPWADYLVDLGFSVAVPRLPGHGTNLHDMINTTWPDWYQAVEDDYLWLAERCDQVFAAGLSMGGALVLRLAEHHDVAGLILVNPAIAMDAPKFKLIPLLSKFISTIPAISGDIKKPGADEGAYDRTPLKPAASMLQLWAEIRADLDQITAPILLFTSREDHVVDAATGRILLGSNLTVERRWLENSYHVATLDNDADEIFAASVEFIDEHRLPDETVPAV